MDNREDFIASVHKCTDLPQSVRDAASTVLGLEESSFDSTYLEFLDEQIELNARGYEWSDRLRRRRSGLAEWCEHPLLSGRIVVGVDEYTVKVDRETRSVAYWEKYAGMHDAME